MKTKWSEGLKTGIAEIDDEHREIFCRLHEIDSIVRSTSDRTRILCVLQVMEDLCEKHFRLEEYLMGRFSYRNIKDHIEEHREYLSRIQEFKSILGSCPDYLVCRIRVDETLGKWWADHILSTDIHMSEHLENQYKSLQTANAQAMG